MREQTRLGVAFEAPGCETVLGDEATKQQEVDVRVHGFGKPVAGRPCALQAESDSAMLSVAPSTLHGSPAPAGTGAAGGTNRHARGEYLRGRHCLPAHRLPGRHRHRDSRRPPPRRVCKQADRRDAQALAENLRSPRQPACATTMVALRRLSVAAARLFAFRDACPVHKASGSSEPGPAALWCDRGRLRGGLGSLLSAHRPQERSGPDAALLAPRGADHPRLAAPSWPRCSRWVGCCRCGAPLGSSHHGISSLAGANPSRMATLGARAGERPLRRQPS